MALSIGFNTFNTSALCISFKILSSPFGGTLTHFPGLNILTFSLFMVQQSLCQHSPSLPSTLQSFIRVICEANDLKTLSDDLFSNAPRNLIASLVRNKSGEMIIVT